MEPQRWKPPRGERRVNVNQRDRKPRSAVYQGPCSGCSAEMSVCSLVCVACKNRQATVNQLTANTNLRCEQQQHLSLRRAITHGFCLWWHVSAWSLLHYVLKKTIPPAMKERGERNSKVTEQVVLHCSIRWPRGAWVRVNRIRLFEVNRWFIWCWKHFTRQCMTCATVHMMMFIFR